MARIQNLSFALLRIALMLFVATLAQRGLAETVQAQPADGSSGTHVAAADTSQGSSSSSKDDSSDDDDDDDDGEEQQ
jgi:hypothetical protein